MGVQGVVGVRWVYGMVRGDWPGMVGVGALRGGVVLGVLDPGVGVVGWVVKGVVGWGSRAHSMDLLPNLWLFH